MLSYTPFSFIYLTGELAIGFQGVDPDSCGFIPHCQILPLALFGITQCIVIGLCFRLEKPWIDSVREPLASWYAPSWDLQSPSIPIVNEIKDGLACAFYS
jgi:hypothetical protein